MPLAKRITVQEIMKVNPGMSLPEAVAKLNAYNTALATGLPAPLLTGPTEPLPVNLNFTANSPAMLAAAACNAAITGKHLLNYQLKSKFHLFVHFYS